MKRLALFFMLVASAHATTWYVNASASGANNGTSAINAWTALSSVGTNMVAGDVCYVASGTYNVKWTLAEGGTSTAARMTFIGTGATKPIVRGIEGGTYNYVAIVNFEFTQPTNPTAYPCINWNGASGWLVQDCYFHDTYGEGINGQYNTVNSNHIIRGNTFADIGATGAGVSGQIVIGIFGDANLIEYNTVTKSMDRVRCFGAGNVVRNNYWGATDTSYYASASPYPFHTDGFQAYESSRALTQLLYERNYDTDNQDTIGQATDAVNGHAFIVQDSVGSSGLQWFIVRNNVLIREAEAISILQNVNLVRWYNNTHVAIGYNHTSNYHNAMTWNSSGSSDYDYRNNTFSFNPRMLDSAGLITTSNRPTGFTSAANHAYNTSTQSVLPTGASPANLAQTDPLFTDGTGVAGHDDYRPTVSSPLKGAAAGITIASGAGTGSTSLTVVDSKRLYDGASGNGWAGTASDADYIKIGSGAYVQITGINYTTHVVTLASARTWSNADSVFVQGTEDVGALPYGSATPSGTYSASGNDYTCTVSGDARFVEFLENGIPQSLDYTAPYTWTSSGGTVTVNVYALYASATPVVAASALESVTPAKSRRNPAATMAGGF